METKTIRRAASGSFPFASGLAAVALAGGCADLAGPRHVLTEVYNSLGGPGWDARDNWASDAPLGTWYGVTTDSEGRVTGLNLNGNGLTGSIPAVTGSLKALDTLDLGRNALSGSIPPELGNLTRLVYLNLHDNGRTLFADGLAGPIPPELGDLRSLQQLILSQNDLTGPIPPGLGNLRHLLRLSLSGNDLTGAIPSELGDLNELAILDLSYNEDLTGTVPPALGNLEQLRLLLIHATGLSGRLPRELIGVPLDMFLWDRTDLCAPADEEFQRWLASIPDHRGGGECAP
ncbi:MAG: hypothetical protein OXK74_17230 [Gemmatimonadota bacterium]|nr:hypothetical protein [Gemmatimonadota bacterium]